jgi:Fe2+ or Zn2+ uptake regulation protein
VDFDLAVADDLVRAAVRKTRFKPKSVHLTLRGLCPDCRDEK